MRPPISFIDFSRVLRGKKIIKTSYINGQKRQVEIPKYILYWRGYDFSEIKKNYDVFER